MNYKRTICIGIAFLWITAFWQVYDNIVPLILKNSFALEETASGIIMAADNVIAVVLLPFFGAWSDRVNTRFGKRMPFIVVGTLLSVLFMMLVPAADNSRNFPVFAVSLGAVLLSMGLYRSPAVALMPDLTPPEYRSQGNAVICIMGALGSMYSLIMIQFLVPAEANPDYTVLFLSIAALMIAGLILLLL
ncbi:MAG: MFS transporter, partial [Clostridia bacterium]|nr:MFS transporter [Clostridia bacterium]